MLSSKKCPNSERIAELLRPMNDDSRKIYDLLSIDLWFAVAAIREMSEEPLTAT